MNRLNKAQKDRITQFRTVTGASEKVATDCLKATGWGLEASLDHFYSSGVAATVAPPVDTRGAEQLFNKYKDPSLDNMISAEGVSQFCEDLGVDPTDVVMLVISQYMNAEVMGEYRRDEFMGGLQRMGCDSLEKLKKKVPDLRTELKREDRFREVYNYTYMFGREKGQKCVQQDTAIGLWSLLLGDPEQPRWALTADWCEFLQKHHNRAISKDTWVQLYDFITTVSPDFSNFDESAAWPVLIDEFVDFMKAKRGQ